MPISLNTNTLALQASHNLELTTQSFTQAVQRLSSGLRINSAADDPPGMAISQKLIAQINGLEQGQRNAQDAVSLLQTAETGLNQTLADLQRLNQLGVQAANGTLSSSDLQNIQLEVQGLVQDIDRIAKQTAFNTLPLLNGSLGSTVKGGGPNVTNVQVQAGVTKSGTYTITATTNATQGAIEGNTQGNATFQGGGSITIVGPTGESRTYQSFAGETVSNFLEQVNNDNLGVTLSIDATTNRYQLLSNDFGFKGTDANGNTNSTGPQAGSAPNQAVAVIASATDPDFGTGAGASMGLAPGSAGASGYGSVVAGAFVAGANPVNAKVTVSNGSSVAVTLQGVNSDEFAGTGIASGLDFRVVNPGSISTNVDSITVTQGNGLKFEVGAGGGATVGLAIDDQSSRALGVNAIDMTTQGGAQSAITAIQNAINQVSTVQTNLGAIQNVLTNAGNLAGAQQLNLQSANSHIRDADITQEAVQFTRSQILLQAGTAVLAQANQTGAGVLSLFNPNGPVL